MGDWQPEIRCYPLLPVRASVFPVPADLSLCFSAWPSNRIQAVSQVRGCGPHAWLFVRLAGASPHTRGMKSSGDGPAVYTRTMPPAAPVRCP